MIFRPKIDCDVRARYAMKYTRVCASVLEDWRDIFAKYDLYLADDEPNAQAADADAGLDQIRAVSLARFVRQLEKVGGADVKTQLSWRAGLSGRYAARGKVGRTVLSAKTLGAGLRRLAEFFPLIQDATFLKLDIEPQWTNLSYKILDPDIWPRHEDAMYSLGLYANLIRCAAPDIWRQVEITVEAEQNVAQADVSNVVRANVVYGGASNNIRFPTSALDAPLGLTSAVENGALTELSQEVVNKRRQTPIDERARAKIYEELNEGNIAQEHIARELGVSSRTLRRKLAAKNLSFQGLLDDCRMRAAALEFKMQKAASLSEIALKLGYSEHSTFSRAFVRWSGLPPEDYRRAVAVH